MKRCVLLAMLAAWPAQAAAFPVTVESCGQPVSFAAAPRRMVVHDINMTEMALALDLQDRIVGVTGISGWYKTSDSFNQALGDIPELAPKYPSLETLVAAEPDLFLAGWYYGMKPGGEVTPDTLAVHDIPTLVLTESCVHLDKQRPEAAMALLFDDVLRLGTVFGRPDKAADLVAGWRTRLQEIRRAVGDRGGVRTFLYDSGDEKPFTAGRFAILTAMINAAGGVNVMADMDTSWGRTSWETVAARNPEFLILLDYQDGGGQDGGGYRKLLSFLKAHPAMAETDAVRQDRFVALRYEELTPGPANIEAIDKIARAMHPAVF